MNKKKGLIICGVILAVVAIIVLVIVLINANGNEGVKKTTGSFFNTTEAMELTTRAEDNTENNAENNIEKTTVEESTEETTEKNTEEETTEKKQSVNDYPTEENLAYREVLKNQIFETGYDSFEEAYLHMLQVYSRAYRYSEVECSLVDYDGDAVSELVVEVNSGITMYTYKNGNVYKLIDDWGYGAGGNHGYDFIPGKKIIRNYNTDYAGLIMNETYFSIELDGEEVVNNPKYLKQTFFDDVNNNGVPDDGEATGEAYVRYYLDEKEITEEKYAEAVVEGIYENLDGKAGTYDVTEILEKPDLVEISDAGCKKAYLKTIEEFEQWIQSEYGADIPTSYALIDFDGDEALELVCHFGSYTINLYTYKDGKIYQLMDQWGGGVGGNHGYEYIPGENIYRNDDSDGTENYKFYGKLNENNELERLYYINIEYGEYKADGLNRYYKGTDDGEVEITEDEYNELELKGNFRLIKGWFSREEIESCLK